MKVYELIEKLKEFDAELNVKIKGFDEEGYFNGKVFDLYTSDINLEYDNDEDEDYVAIG